MDILISYQKGQLPQSIESALINQNDCIQQCQERIDALTVEIDGLYSKIEICIDIKMPHKGLLNIITRRKKEVAVLTKAIKAYQLGFMEIPDLNRNAREFDTNNKGDRNWVKAVLPIEAPLRVFQDLKAAKESGLFDKIVFFTPSRAGSDPIIAGRIGARVFLISNYR